MPWDDLYALATPEAPFNMLFNTVNVLRPRSPAREPGGSLMVYRAGHAALTMFDQPDAVVEQAFLDDLYAIYPEARGIVSETMHAQAAAHAAVRDARPRRPCSLRSSGRSAASIWPATTWAASTPTPRSRAARRPRSRCGGAAGRPIPA